MPPRIPIQSCSKSLNGPFCNWFAGLTIRPCVSRSASTNQKRKHQDPYSLAQARQRKAANISRQRVLKEEREAALGDPVRGKPTAVTEAILNGQVIPSSAPGISDQGPYTSSELNYFVTKDELATALGRSQNLTKPVVDNGSPTFDPQQAEEETKSHAEKHKNAEEVMKRIMGLGNASTKDITRLNIRRCIESFGRHNTDAILPPKPASDIHPSAPKHELRTPRAGPDTGSSEVQIAVLTTKILALAKSLETTSHKDKHNKRNLRLLVHKRQKLLQYLRRKERGGPRWQNLVTSLGLSDATWKGQISL